MKRSIAIITCFLLLLFVQLVSAQMVIAQTVGFTDDATFPTKSPHRVGSKFVNIIAYHSDGTPAAWFFEDGLTSGIIADQFQDAYVLSNNTTTQGTNLASTSAGVINGNDGNQHFIPSYDNVLLGVPPVPLYFALTFAYSRLTLGDFGPGFTLPDTLSNSAALGATYGSLSIGNTPSHVNIVIEAGQAARPFLLYNHNSYDYNYADVSVMP